MRQTALHATVTSVMAALLLAAPMPADAKKKKQRTPTPAYSNSEEWALIGLTPDIVGSANGGSGVGIALLDGYTDCGHPDLATRCQANQIYGGRYRYYDDHGTHTAGIIAGAKTGAAPKARIINYGVFDDYGYVATGTKLIDSWKNAYASGASIASMSFGCSGRALCFTDAELRTMTTTPMVYVKAAGNDGTALVSETSGLSRTEAVAALDRTILVGSVELNGQLSSYSNRPGEGCLLYSGATGCRPDTQWKYYFIVAPGSSIYSTLPNKGYGLMSGTSMATPVVAGAAALLQARWPVLKSNPEAVADILFISATDLGAPGVDSVYGWGLLNITRAFQSQGHVAVVSPTGGSTVMNGTNIGSSPTFARFAAALGPVTVYDRYGRDFSLRETGALKSRTSYEMMHRLLGRRLLGLGGQAEWAAALFAERHAPIGFAGTSSFADPAAGAQGTDQSLRMGIDMPFKGGVAQLRMTGAASTRADFAYDPSLRPLSFFASSALMKSSMFGQALLNVGKNSRLAIYGVTNSPGSLSVSVPGEPLFLKDFGRDSATRLAITGEPNDLKQHGFGVGFWMKPDHKTVLGINLSYISQRGGYYDMTSDLPGLDGSARMLNLGAVASRAIGSWEVSIAGEATHIRTSGTATDMLRLTPSNIVSAELRARKTGVAFNDGRLADSLSVALVLPPRAVSGDLRVDYMTRTDDGLGMRAETYTHALSKVTADPPKIEAGYRLTSGKRWTLDLSGGLNLKQGYAGRGEALASFRMGF